VGNSDPLNPVSCKRRIDGLARIAAVNVHAIKAKREANE